MRYYIYRLADGLFLRGGTIPLPYDPDTEGIQDYPSHLIPDIERERFDATAPTKKRKATAEEMAAYAVEKKDRRVQQAFDSMEWEALFVWLAERFQMTPSDVRHQVAVKLKTLI